MIDKKVEELRREFYKNFVAPDGLGKLSGEDNRVPFREGAPATCYNDNGILFLMYFLALVHEELGYIKDDSIHFTYAATPLEDPGNPGIFHRHNGDHLHTEAHDNYMALCAGTVLFGGGYAQRICDYGDKMGWSFANLAPNTWAFSQLRQGGEIAFCQVCAERIPTIWNWVWFLLGVLISSFKGDPSVLNLTWLRLYAISHKLYQEQAILYRPGFFIPTRQPAWLKASFGAVYFIWKAIVKLRLGSEYAGFLSYFSATHPVRRLVLLKLDG